MIVWTFDDGKRQKERGREREGERERERQSDNKLNNPQPVLQGVH